MSSAVFISYRRQDSEAEARALFERLCLVFGPERVFIDMQGIPIGQDFVAVLRERLSNCQVLLAVIGEHWTGDDGHDARRRRIWDESDFVRMEVRAALNTGVTVIPVLVCRAGLPSPEHLPADLHPLLRLHAARLRMASFDSDVTPLIESIRPQLPAPHPPARRVGAGWNHRVLAACLAGLGIAASGLYASRETWGPSSGAQDCRPSNATQGFLNKCSGLDSRDGATILRQWPTPLSWEAGQEPLRLPVALKYYAYDEYKSLEVPRDRAVSATAYKELRGIDEAAGQILKAQTEKVEQTNWYAKLGLKRVLAIPEAFDEPTPFLDVTYLSEWQRHAFNKELAIDHYRQAGKRYEAQRRAWFAKPEIEFPAFLFSEFLVISNDPDGGLAVVLTKGEKATNGKRGSMLADILDEVVSSASIETSPRIGPSGDFEFDSKRGLHQINMTSVVARGLKEIGYQGLADAGVKRIINYGVAFQEGLMNAALLSSVWLDRSCEQIKQAARERDTAVECISPEAAGRYLSHSDRHWHPTARLRMALWRNHLQLHHAPEIASTAPTHRPNN